MFPRALGGPDASHNALVTQTNLSKITFFFSFFPHHLVSFPHCEFYSPTFASDEPPSVHPHLSVSLPLSSLYLPLSVFPSPFISSPSRLLPQPPSSSLSSIKRAQAFLGGFNPVGNVSGKADYLSEPHDFWRKFTHT